MRSLQPKPKPRSATFKAGCGLKNFQHIFLQILHNCFHQCRCGCLVSFESSDSIMVLPGVAWTRQKKSSQGRTADVVDWNGNGQPTARVIFSTYIIYSLIANESPHSKFFEAKQLCYISKHYLIVRYCCILREPPKKGLKYAHCEIKTKMKCNFVMHTSHVKTFGFKKPFWYVWALSVNIRKGPSLPLYKSDKPVYQWFESRSCL